VNILRLSERPTGRQQLDYIQDVRYLHWTDKCIRYTARAERVAAAASFTQPSTPSPLTRTAQIRCPDRKRHWRRCRVGALRPPGSHGSRAASASRPTRAGKAAGADPGSSADARGPARRWTACACRRTPDAGIPATRTCDALCVDGGGPALHVFNSLSLSLF